MVFSSFVFLLIFFLSVLLLYYITPVKIRNLLLLLASLFFYAWGEPVYALVMLASIALNYVSGVCIGTFHERGKGKAAKRTLIINVIGNLGILGFFKYADFLIENVNSLTGTGFSLLHIALPIGISFYTFQTMSYVIDVYWKVVPAQKNIITLATYVTLFPQLIAGPIVQYKTVEKELVNRRVSVEGFAKGAYRFVIGLAKKVLLANQVGALFTTINGLEELSMATAWLGAICYTFQIYFDFSGYSDMAIGIGEMFGFHFLENFNYPYISKNITEFWRRWHISLSSWFKEYVYIPLGGNRKGLKRQLFNIIIVWLLTGLWHGANWNFVLWGVYYGCLLMIEKVFLLKRLKRIPAALQHVYCMFFVVIGWTIFAQTDFRVLGDYLKAMFGIAVPFVDATFFYYFSSNVMLLVILIIASLDWKALLNKQSKLKGLWKSDFAEMGRVIAMVVLLIVSFAFLVGNSYNPFLYFRF